MNRMSYKEALEQLKKLENEQRMHKYVRRRFSGLNSTAFVRNLNYTINKIKKEINLLLSIIHAHKLSRKLYAEVKFLKEQYGA